MLTVHDYLPIFKRFNVKLVIRLNTPTYSPQPFLDNHIHHLDLFFQDGTCPPRPLILKFL
jgi:cell division cycle 14